MQQIIHLSVGQCGNQIGQNFWQTITTEHGIDMSTGLYNEDNIHSEFKDYQLERAGVYFSETDSSTPKYVPRAVLIDLEPGVVDSIKGSTIGNLFNPDSFVHGQNGAGNNWAKGFYTEGAELIDDIFDQIRKEAEKCDVLQGFSLTHSLGGGTGSGLGTGTISKLKEEYPDRMVSTFSVFPSQISDVIVEPYNAVLSIHQLIENSNAVFCLDNAALQNIHQNNQKNVKSRKFASIEESHEQLSGSFAPLNNMINQVMSGVTCSLRFPGQLNSDMRKFCVNLTPFPRNHFFTCSQAPLSNQTTRTYSQGSVHEIVSELFSPHNVMVMTDPRQGKYLTSAVIIRGDASMKSFEECVLNMQAKTSSMFVDWIPNNIQINHCKVPGVGAVNGEKSSKVTGTLIANSTSITPLLTRISKQFAMMFKRKAYLHWYTDEGMDEMEFSEAESNVFDLIEGYSACNCCSDETEAEEESFGGTPKCTTAEEDTDF